MSPFFTLERLKSPSSPVMVPFVVPLTTTDAPMTVSPVESSTTPVQVPFCWAIIAPEAGFGDAAFTLPAAIADRSSKKAPTGLDFFSIIFKFTS